MKKFLHISDIHFDAPFKAKNDDVRYRIKKSQRDAFSNAISYCIAERCDGLLIAGDLFDGDYVSVLTERYLIEQFELLNKNGIKVYYAPGNHDPITNFKMLVPENVHVFNTGKSEVLEFDGIKIVGVGHMTSRESNNLIKDFPVKGHDEVVVGIAHAMVSGVTNDSEKGIYLPTTVEDLVSKNYDYFALGHIHKRELLGNGKIGYSGSLHGLSIKECGEKGGYLIEINQGVTNVSFVPFAGLHFEQITIEVTDDVNTDMELYDVVLDELKAYHSNSYVRVILTGRLPKDYLGRINEFEENLSIDANIFHVEVKNRLKQRIDEEELISLSPVLRTALELLEDSNLDGLFDNGAYLKLKKSDFEGFVERNKDELKARLVELFVGDSYEI